MAQAQRKPGYGGYPKPTVGRAPEPVKPRKPLQAPKPVEATAYKKAKARYGR